MSNRYEVFDITDVEIGIEHTDDLYQFEDDGTPGIVFIVGQDGSHAVVRGDMAKVAAALRASADEIDLHLSDDARHAPDDDHEDEVIDAKTLYVDDVDDEPGRPDHVRFPHITVDLSRANGNAYGILAAVRKTLRKHDVDEAVIEEFLTEAKAGDYDDLIQTTMRWVVVA